MTQKISRPPPKPPSEELTDAKAALDDACAKVAAATQRLDEKTKGLKRAISDPRMRAVRLPTPSQLDLEEKP